MREVPISLAQIPAENLDEPDHLFSQTGHANPPSPLDRTLARARENTADELCEVIAELGQGAERGGRGYGWFDGEGEGTRGLAEDAEELNEYLREAGWKGLKGSEGGGGRRRRTRRSMSGCGCAKAFEVGADEREGSVEFCGKRSKSVSPAISEALQPARFLPRREWVAGIAIESETRKRQRTRFMVQGKETRYFVIIAKWEESKVPRMKFASA